MGVGRSQLQVDPQTTSAAPAGHPLRQRHGMALPCRVRADRRRQQGGQAGGQSDPVGMGLAGLEWEEGEGLERSCDGRMVGLLVSLPFVKHCIFVRVCLIISGGGGNGVAFSLPTMGRLKSLFVWFPTHKNSLLSSSHYSSFFIFPSMYISLISLNHLQALFLKHTQCLSHSPDSPFLGSDPHCHFTSTHCRTPCHSLMWDLVPCHCEPSLGLVKERRRGDSEQAGFLPLPHHFAFSCCWCVLSFF